MLMKCFTYINHLFMTWEQNVHASMFCNAWQFLLKTGLCNG
ncbi:FlhC family transcriptional regulator, partial [Escherichia coli]